MIKIYEGLTDKQYKAVAALGRAFKKCKEANVYFHNCYGKLIPFDGNIIHCVDDNEGEGRCYEGYFVEQHGYDLDSWADDDHWYHLLPTRPLKGNGGD